MQCPSCPADVLALFICDDNVYRCYECKRSRPVPLQHRLGPMTSRFVKDMRRKAGLCPRCGEPGEGKVYCAKHRAEYAAATRRIREAAR